MRPPAACPLPCVPPAVRVGTPRRPGSRFIEVTARFVRSFAELDAVMRLYSDAAAFDRDLSDAVAKANAAPAQ